MFKVLIILGLQLIGTCTYAGWTNRQEHDALVKKETEAVLQKNHQQISKNAQNIAHQNQSIRAAMTKNK